MHARLYIFKFDKPIAQYRSLTIKCQCHCLPYSSPLLLESVSHVTTVITPKMSAAHKLDECKFTERGVLGV